ncbi:MAG: hypothetical protein ACOYMF_06220 [Bacteroidales bacterium]
MKIVILTQSAREQHALKLQQQIPGAIIHYDTISRGHIFGIESALKIQYEKGIDYLLLIEDDVILCDKFIQSVTNVLAANIDRNVITFFSVSDESYNAIEKGFYWIEQEITSWNQCIAYPEEIIQGLINYPKLPRLRHGDVWLSMYCLANGIKILQPLPHFVQHKELPSTYGNPKTLFGKKRISKVWGSGAGIDYAANYRNRFISKNTRTMSKYVKAYS